MDATITVSIIGGLFLLTATIIQVRHNKKVNESARKEQDNKDIASQIETFQSNLMKTIDTLQDDKDNMDIRIDNLNNTIETLKSKVDTLKSGIMTLNLFGHNSPIAMWVKDQNGKRLYHNPAYEELTGYLIKDCIGLTDYEIIGNKELADNWAEMDEQVKTSKQPMIDLEVYAHKDTPEDIKPIISFKWPVMLHSHVIGVEAAGIPIKDISHLVQMALDKTHSDGV